MGTKSKGRRKNKAKKESKCKQEVYYTSPSSPSYIPDDVILYILYKLPIRSQLRLQCVSKHWLDLISDPDRSDSCYSYRLRKYSDSPTSILCGFFTSHGLSFNHHTPSDFISIEHSNSSNMKLDSQLSFLDKQCFVKVYKHMVLAASNGLLLCGRWSCLSYRLDSYVICNPFTGQNLSLPAPAGDFYLSDATNVGFDCHLGGSRKNIVDYYTVVLLIKGPGSVRAKIFTSTDPRWITVKLHGLIEISTLSFRGGPFTAVGFIKGVFYFVAYYLDLFNIVACDLKKGQMTASYMAFSQRSTILSLCVCEDRLYCGLVKYKTFREADLQLWVSQKDTRGLGSEYGWQMDCCVRNVEVGAYDIGSPRGSHPGNPRLVFFTTSTDLKSFDFQREELKTCAKMKRQNFDCTVLIPCQWLRPWPVSFRK